MTYVKTLAALTLGLAVATTLVNAQEAPRRADDDTRRVERDDRRDRNTDDDRPGVIVAFVKPDITVSPALGASSIEGLPGTGYCAYNNQQPSDELVFNVSNNGAIATGPFLVHVGFQPKNQPTVSILVNIPNLAPGQTSARHVDVPAAAMGIGHLQFTVFADSTNVVSESMETNNHDSGYCLTPAG